MSLVLAISLLLLLLNNHCHEWASVCVCVCVRASSKFIKVSSFAQPAGKSESYQRGDDSNCLSYGKDSNARQGEWNGKKGQLGWLSLCSVKTSLFKADHWTAWCHISHMGRLDVCFLGPEQSLVHKRFNTTHQEGIVFRHFFY